MGRGGTARVVAHPGLEKEVEEVFVGPADPLGLFFSDKTNTFCFDHKFRKSLFYQDFIFNQELFYQEFLRHRLRQLEEPTGTGGYTFVPAWTLIKGNTRRLVETGLLHAGAHTQGPSTSAPKRNPNGSRSILGS